MATTWYHLAGLLYILSFSENRFVNAQASSPSANVCSALGSDITTEFTKSSRNKLFMNFGAPAQCNGTVTSWHFCSYNQYVQDTECEDTESYNSVFLVYRQAGNSTYQRVSGSSRTVTISLNCPSDGGFRCDRSQTLSSSEQFDIQENDIVAACLRNIGFNANPIQLVGEQSSGPSRQVYWYDGDVFSACPSPQLESIDIQNSAFTLNGGVYRLHLYAEIDSPVAQCSGGSNPPPFTPFTNSGTYLNTDSPISCSDTITSWHYCYYPSQASDSQLTYTATVGVWRLNSVTNQYELLQGSDYTLQLVQPASTPAVIFCRPELLQPQDYVRVERGDVIGVSLPQQNPLPIVASGATGYSLKTHNALNAPRTIQQSTLTDASSMALHLYPTIEFVPLPTTEPPLPPTTEAPTTTVPPTTEAQTAQSPTTEARTTVSRTTEAIITSPTTIAKTTQAAITTSLPIATVSPSTETRTDLPWPVTTTERDQSTTNVVSLGDSGASGEQSNTTAIVIIVLLLILVIVLVVLVVVAYQMKMFGRLKRNVSKYRSRLKVRVLRRGSSSEELVSPYYYSNINDYDVVLPHYELAEHSAAKHRDTQDPQIDYSEIEPDSGHIYSTLEERDSSLLESSEDPYYLPANEESELYAQLHKQGIKMIRTKDIEITGGVLGQGQFGMVKSGIWKEESHGTRDVAIKMLKAGSDEHETVKFLQEAAIMAQFKHSNVVSLYGVVSAGGLLMIVVELLPKGDLKQHLVSMQPDPGLLLPSFTPKKLLTFCQQIALGMQYLASKGFVHRDLAARNILLSEGCICKIADFGMSRDLAEEDYYVSHGGKIPIKWTAPEAIHFRKYSTASDVWSYGCLLYEIWSLGHKPFGAMTNPEVVMKVDSGYRLPPPPGCPKAIYSIVIDCWHPSGENRPSFRSILMILLEKEEVVLSIPSDLGGSSLAAVLGAPIEAGFDMYNELQTKYQVDLV